MTAHLAARAFHSTSQGKPLRPLRTIRPSLLGFWPLEHSSFDEVAQGVTSEINPTYAEATHWGSKASPSAGSS
jgi:hypothetical protein